MLHLVDFTTVLHQLDRFCSGQRIDFEGQIFLHDLLHFLLDGRQILVRQLHVAQVDVIMKALFRRGAVGEVCLRIQPFHRLRHDVRAGMTQHFKLQFLRAFRHVTVIVDNFHVPFLPC